MLFRVVSMCFLALNRASYGFLSQNKTFFFVISWKNFLLSGAFKGKTREEPAGAFPASFGERSLFDPLNDV